MLNVTIKLFLICFFLFASLSHTYASQADLSFDLFYDHNCDQALADHKNTNNKNPFTEAAEIYFNAIQLRLQTVGLNLEANLFHIRQALNPLKAALENNTITMSDLDCLKDIRDLLRSDEGFFMAPNQTDLSLEQKKRYYSFLGVALARNILGLVFFYKAKNIISQDISLLPESDALLTSLYKNFIEDKRPYQAGNYWETMDLSYLQTPDNSLFARLINSKSALNIHIWLSKKIEKEKSELDQLSETTPSSDVLQSKKASLIFLLQLEATGRAIRDHLQLDGIRLDNAAFLLLARTLTQKTIEKAKQLARLQETVDIPANFFQQLKKQKIIISTFNTIHTYKDFCDYITERLQYELHDAEELLNRGESPSSYYNMFVENYVYEIEKIFRILESLPTHANR